MKHYYSTKEPIASGVDAIMVQIGYEAGHGYVVTAAPCGFLGDMVRVTFDRDYFTKYAPLRHVQFPCTRRSRKIEAQAEAWLTSDQSRAIALLYCDKIKEKCGQVVELQLPNQI